MKNAVRMCSSCLGPEFSAWTADDLESEFTLDSIRELEAILKRRAKCSETARQTLRNQQGLQYGSRPGERLNLFPFPGSSAPMLIYIHGGFWRANNAATFDFVAAGFVPRGVTVLNLDYDLYPEANLDIIIDECRNAVAWAYRNARSFGADPNRLFVSGNSAGGHLVATLMDRGWTASKGLPCDVIKGGCAISGVYDIAPVSMTSQQDVFAFDADQIERLSPLRCVPDDASPLIAAVGGCETPIFRHLHNLLSRAWRNRGLPIACFEPPQANHITVALDEFAREGSSLNNMMLRQIGVLDGAH